VEVWLSRERESEGTACVVVVSGSRFESFFLFVFFCTYGHARTGTHVRAHESEGTACVVVVSGARFESFFYFYFARTGTHIRACTSFLNFNFVGHMVWRPELLIFHLGSFFKILNKAQLAVPGWI